MKEYQLGLYEKAMPNTLSWEEKLKCVKAHGFDYLEMSIDETPEKQQRLKMSQKERNHLVTLMKQVGVPIGSICLSGHRKYPLGSRNGQDRIRSMEIMEDAVILASDLGIPVIQLAGYDVYYEESGEDTKGYFTENLKKSVEIGAKYGVILAFETMEQEFINTVEKAMVYVKKVNSPYLGVYPDCGNITNAAVSYGTNVLQDVSTGAGHLFAMHLKETVPGKFREIPYGTGHVDFPKMIETAWELGVRRYVTEFWYTGNPQWEEELTYAKEFMEKAFQQALKE